MLSLEFTNPKMCRLAVFVCALLIGSTLCAGAEPSEPSNSDTQAALKLLGEQTPQGQAAAIAGMEQSHRAGELGARHVELLAGLIEEPNWTLTHRRRVAFLLASLGGVSRPALEKLAANAGAPSAPIVREAIRFHDLVVQTTSPEMEVREAAVKALPDFAAAHPDSFPAAIQCLVAAYTRPNEPRREIRIAALQALLRFGERAAPTLVETFGQEDPFFYRYTKSALKGLRDEARPALLDGLNHREELVRLRSIYVLWELGLDEEAAKAMAPLEDDRDEIVRKTARRALAAYQAAANGP